MLLGLFNSSIETVKEVSPTAATASLVGIVALGAGAVGLYNLYQNKKAPSNPPKDADIQSQSMPELSHVWRSAKPTQAPQKRITQEKLKQKIIPNQFDNEAIDDLVDLVSKLGYFGAWDEKNLRTYLKHLEIPQEATDSYLTLKEFLEIQISENRMTKGGLVLNTQVGVTYEKYEQLYKGLMQRCKESTRRTFKYI